MMSYREILEQAPADYLENVALENGIRRDIQGERLLEAIHQRLTDKGYLASLVSKFHPMSRTLLRFLTFASGEEGVGVFQFQRKLPQLQEGKQRLEGSFIQPLIRKGLVITATTRPGRYCYLVPEEIVEALVPAFASEIRESLGVIPEPAGPIRQDGEAFLRDLYIFLAYANQESLRITQAGRLYKRNLTRLQERFEIPPETADPSGRFLEDQRVQWMLEFSRDAHLLEVKDGQLTVQEPSVTIWMENPSEEHLRHLYHFWWSFQEFATYPLLCTWTLERILKTLAHDEWWSSSSFLKLIHLLSPDGVKGANLEELLWEQFFIPWVYFGWLKHAEREDAFALTQVGYRLIHDLPIRLEPQATYTFVIQPNYEVLADKRLEPKIRWELGHVATLQKCDQMIVYLLDQKAIYRALKSGWTSGAIMEFLNRYSRTGVPQNVAYSIENWASQYGRLEFVDALLLRCADASLAEEIRSNPRLRPHILGQISPTYLVVSRAGQHHLASLLEELGYMPKPGVLNASEKGNDAHPDPA